MRTVTRRPLRIALGIATGLLLGAGTLLAAAPASAAVPSAQSAPAGEGWIRLAHLSPDTKGIDVRISALKGGTTLYELDNVKYGAVSPYTPMPDGTYTVSMVPTGSPASTKPMLSSAVTIADGHASTVAAYGPNKKIAVSVYDDDLTAPSNGGARIRLIQASTLAQTVSVRTSTGVAVASKAKRGTATGYAEVGAGPWTLDLSAKSAGSAKKTLTDSAQVALAQGSVTTLFVLDTADGGLTIEPVLDSASVGQDPVGGVQTGGGYLATHPQTTLGGTPG
ncbi:DUF4397 domain-containing protein [Lacisediminihabitans changchengi]|uniref:DUF4397 domain-containing protein n=1 Tax=Lacisediminihabitans changchengi TaxID=2787634 RepID=A0A934SM18_9MICO|nr:DUF4397 domain-containing protein [Lacisediminihabitans changchengi]MBK4347016.1 DUF4397 domain-containing protein [Lacisediminihabitans changchengi]MBK4347861.1 DUF4397 domain-containing protein [Lacisediminihabitans changchengi]